MCIWWKHYKNMEKHLKSTRGGHFELIEISKKVLLKKKKKKLNLELVTQFSGSK